MYSTTVHQTQIPSFYIAPETWYYTSIATHHRFLNREGTASLGVIYISETKVPTPTSHLYHIKHFHHITVQYRYVPYLRCLQGRHGIKDEGVGGRCGGAKRRQRKHFRTPWKTRRKLRGGGSVRRWARSRKRNRKIEVGRVG